MTAALPTVAHPTASHPATLLRRVLYADAAISGLSGLVMALDADLLEGLLAVPADLLRTAGISLLPWAVAIGFLATRATLSRPAVWAVIVANAVWAADCAILLVSGWIAPTGLGYAFVIAQALVVIVLAELQYVGLRRAASAA